MKRILALAAAIFIASCSSVPLSTMVRGASFNEGNFGFLDARALRVKVAVPEGFVLDLERTRLAASISSSTGTRQADFVLQSIDTVAEKRGGGYFSKEIAVTTYEMNLTDPSVKSLRELQGFVASGKVKNFSLDVQVKLKEISPGATSAKVWVDLMLSPMEGYFPLVDGASVDVKILRP
jgi:hypothetical protein